MKELRAMFGFLLAIIVGYLYIYDGNLIRAVSPGTPRTPVSLPPAGTKIAVLELFNKINTNDRGKSLNFLVWKDGRWQGAQAIGCNEEFYRNYKDPKDNTNNVQLISDKARVEDFIKNNQIQAADKKKALRIWLYFELTIAGKKYDLHLNDPNPGEGFWALVNVGGKRQKKMIYPASNILNKYN